MIIGRRYISTGFRRTPRGYWHALVAAHRRWRFGFVQPPAKPGYSRLYFGPLEFEWSRRAALANGEGGDHAEG